MATAECVKVIVRCRPINERERNLKCKVVVKMDSKRGTCSIQPGDPKAPPKTFTFDGAYYLESTTEAIYEDIAYPLVEGVTEGYNGTIFAYGQTGCGKSFTMQGIKNPTTQRGVIPRAFEHIFETVSVSEATKFLIQASYCEIYQEEIRDLLGTNIKNKLELKEHPEKGVYVNGLSKFTVHSVTECEALMERGWKNRSTGATLMNTDSSRSHSIFTINVEMCREDQDGEDHIRAGKLNLVDLAGSERQNKTGATGERLREATKINLSLSALGNVISALVDGKSTHIPYRDSKLTRLLQDSLGGNTKTLMIACLSPADNNYEETLSTLRYANRAKNIKNKPKINEDPKDALLREYQEEINKLKAMLAGQMPFNPEAMAAVAAPEPQIVEKVVHVDYSNEIEEEKRKIREEYEQQINDLNSMYETERVTKTKLQEDMSKLREFYDVKLNSVDGKYANLPPPAASEAGYEHFMTSDESIVTSSVENVTSPIQRPNTVNAATILGETSDQRRNSESSVGDGARAMMAAQAQAAAAQKEAPTVPPPGPTQQAVYVGSTAAPQAPPQAEAPPQGAPGAQQMAPPAQQVTAAQAAMAQDALKRDIVQSEAEAQARLQELQHQMVGGENANNVEVKERRKKKRKHAEEKRKKLADANSNLEDDGIIEGIFDSIGDELRVKNKLLDKEKQRCVMLEREIIDLQSEFEFDRIDYLDTVRKQEKEIQLLKTLLEKVQPTIRRDCNYSNLDRVRVEARWDEEQGSWTVPPLRLEKTALPTGPDDEVPPLAKMGLAGSTGSHGNRKTSAGGGQFDSDMEDDRYRQRLERSNKEDAAKSYFTSKRAEKLLNGSHDPRNGHHDSAGASQTTALSNGYHGGQATSNGYHGNSGGGGGNLGYMNGHVTSTSNGSLGGSTGNLGDLRAAQVHGQDIDPELPIRKPVRLSSLPPAGSAKKSKKKSRGLDPL